MKPTRAATWIPLATIAVLAACSVELGDLLAGGLGMGNPGFSDMVADHPTGDPFEDAQIDRMVERLDSLLHPPEPERLDRWEAASAIRGLRYALRRGRISDAQAQGVFVYLDELKERHPDSATMIDDERRLLSLTPGLVAPNIVGKDTEGVEFELEDYRGNIVVLVFTGEWCGPCRGEYPYQRELLETYRDEKVVLLGVNSDSKLETAREAKEREGLHYRTWWDGSTNGPISEAWGIWAWPSTFIMDDEGVIRFLNKRQESMIEAVAELLEERRAGEST